jgi:hypothetical protein
MAVAASKTAAAVRLSCPVALVGMFVSLIGLGCGATSAGTRGDRGRACFVSNLSYSVARL